MQPLAQPERRRQRLERFDMGSILDNIKEQLDEILGMEKETIDEWIEQKQRVKSRWGSGPPTL